MSLLLVTPDSRWRRVPSSGVTIPHQIAAHLGSRDPDCLVEVVPLTPSACLWVQVDAGPPNALASALVGFLHQPIRQLRGAACLTGIHPGPHTDTGTEPRPLVSVQERAFSQILTIVLHTPAYLSLHAQAGRIAAAWNTTTTPSSSSSRSTP